MKRKVIKQGHNTLTITLPSKWVRKNSVNPSDEINIEELNNSLILNKTEIKKEKKTLTIELKSEDYQFIRLILNNIYRMGVDSIRINFKTNKQFEYIQDIVNSNLIGIEVIKKEENYCILENIAEPSETDTNVLLRRIFLIINETLEFLETDLKKSSYKSINYVIQQSKKIEQLDNFSKRLIYKKDSENTEISHFYWLLLHYLQLIGRAFFHLYKFLDKNNKIVAGENLIKIIKKLRKGYENFYSSFYKEDINGIDESNKEIKSVLFNDFYDIFPKLNGEEVIVAHWIAEANRLMTLLISPSLGILYHKGSR